MASYPTFPKLQCPPSGRWLPVRNGTFEGGKLTKVVQTVGMLDRQMIPLGYMLKSVAAPAPEWMNAPAVEAVHSLSNCVSSDFADYIPLWEHNGWWLFDSPQAIMAAAQGQDIAPNDLDLFYYEAFDLQYEDEHNFWQPIPAPELPTNVQPPPSAKLSGFDVVTFYAGTSPECSPLSCNGLAADIQTNEHCLFHSFDDAHAAIEGGAFKDSEPGPYRIIAVYKVAKDAE